MKKFSKRMITLLIALAIGCTTGVISYLDVFSEADTMLTNWIYDHTFFLKADHRITIIALDEKSTAEYGNYPDWDCMRRLFPFCPKMMQPSSDWILPLPKIRPATPPVQQPWQTPAKLPEM